MPAKYVIGIDFGTDSVRTLLVNAHTGEEAGCAVHYYPRWKEGKYCNAAVSQFRQHPLDYLESMEACLHEVLAGLSPEVVNNITGISVDTTGSSPVAVDKNGTPLALLPEFSENPNAMFILWKDHTANAEAEEINKLCRRWHTDYTRYSGGAYSSEWFWSKILHTLRVDEQVRQKAFSWMEHSDWMPAVLTGNTNPLTAKRNRCAAGHKAMWHEEFDGLPEEAFWKTLDPLLTGLRSRLYQDTHTADEAAGTISAEWAHRLGLPEHVKIGVGAIDAHFGAVGACIEPYSLVKVMGTSTCDMLIAPAEKHKNHCVKGICGQVDGSILPGMLGMEAGQSAFGDVYFWFKELLSFPLKQLLKDKIPAETLTAAAENILPELNKLAATLPVTEKDVVALDWINGRRTPDADLTLTGTIAGISLGTDAPRIFKALVEATAFGSKAIVERFNDEGVPVKKIIALGGISKKSAFVMQTLSSILNLPIEVIQSEQACALGAAMFAATASGVYPDIQQAQKAMSGGIETVYSPEKDKVAVYEKLYERYKQLQH
ncbi:ribulokinase [Pedobacter sp. BS3]|uniref:ribulokinase n=1 Tax=Pedobacter sp. BS3 TaxID=2567937 RepID=UPI0011EFCB2A|nr:ribulokinase [Pedobacter sp. BS3]TZF81097.1 ribulokinase [Pedobacter sp. BS3]